MCLTYLLNSNPNHVLVCLDLSLQICLINHWYIRQSKFIITLIHVKHYMIKILSTKAHIQCIDRIDRLDSLNPISYLFDSLISVLHSILNFRVDLCWIDVSDKQGWGWGFAISFSAPNGIVLRPFVIVHWFRSTKGRIRFMQGFLCTADPDPNPQEKARRW